MLELPGRGVIDIAESPEDGRGDEKIEFLDIYEREGDNTFGPYVFLGYAFPKNRD